MGAMKLAYPKNMLMLRGNHESRKETKDCLHNECLHKYSNIVYKACMKSFDALPIAAIVNKESFCVHGGLSPWIRRVSEIQDIIRFQEPDTEHKLPGNEAITDLLWSDPTADYVTPIDDILGEWNGDLFRSQFEDNWARQVSFMFTFQAVCEFLRQNDLLCVVRGHQVQDEGHQLFEPYRDDFPSLITLWSAPNYCDTYGNKASILRYDRVRNSADIKTFLSQPHPFVLPNFQNGLEWSLPFACRTVTTFIQALLDVCSEEELEDARIEPEPDLGQESREYVDSLDVEPEPDFGQESREYVDSLGVEPEPDFGQESREYVDSLDVEPEPDFGQESREYVD